MPHQCTNCGHAFPDGSKEMLSGCPECGGNKFQFHPESPPDEPTGDEPDEPETGGSVASAVGKAAASVRDTFSGGDGGDEPDDWPPADAASSPDTDASSTPEIDEPEREDTAQASARSEMVESDDLPPAPEREGRVVQEPESDERPDMDALREELNSQFESIRIVAPGQYELNLMELYDREEYIIALQENGRYVIEVPETWRDDDVDEP